MTNPSSMPGPLPLKLNFSTDASVLRLPAPQKTWASGVTRSVFGVTPHLTSPFDRQEDSNMCTIYDVVDRYVAVSQLGGGLCCLHTRCLHALACRHGLRVCKRVLSCGVQHNGATGV